MLKKTVIIKRLRKNYTYNLKQLQSQFGIHPQTIRAYINDKDNPLKVISKKPILIYSETLREYLRQQVEQRKIKLSEYEFFCMGCKQKHTPFNNMVADVAINNNRNMYKAICPRCFSIMNKYQASKGLNRVLPLFKIISLEDLYILQDENTPEETHKKRKTKKRLNDSRKEEAQTDLFAEVKNG